MKSTFWAFTCLLSIQAFAQKATIKIDIERTIGVIDPKIYGVFMEPIHFNGARLGLPDTVDFNTLYGNLYDPKSPLADANGFRRDYIDAMRELGITNMRWPGGNFVMGYNWQDGIGPKDQRPSRINLAWGGLDNNHVGTDEWIALNQSIGSENIICTNLGLGSIDDARYWVEYCNYDHGTYYSDLRIRNGHRQPYGIRIWDLGNEVDGYPWELGYMNAEDYVKKGREAAKAMRSVDHSIELVASGSSWYEPTGKWVDWNNTILQGLGDLIQYLSIHRYWENASEYYDYMGQSAMDFEEKIKVTQASINAITAMKQFDHPIYISFDEWGTFGRNFKAVLPVAQCLNSFIRHADVVKMANYTLMTSLIQTDPVKGSFKTPLFYAFKLFSNNCLGRSVDAFVAGDTFNTEQFNGIPYLDVTAVYSDESGTAYINVINRHQEKSIPTAIKMISGMTTGKAQITLINAESLDEPFSYDQESSYKPLIAEVDIRQGEINYAFPPHSISQIAVKVKN